MNYNYKSADKIRRENLKLLEDFDIEITDDIREEIDLRLSNPIQLDNYMRGLIRDKLYT